MPVLSEEVAGWTISTPTAQAHVSYRWLAACAGTVSLKWPVSISVTVASRFSRFQKNSITSPAWASHAASRSTSASWKAKFYELSRAFHP